jgi:hypothetical protein
MNAIGLCFTHQIFFKEILELIIIACFEVELKLKSPFLISNCQRDPNHFRSAGKEEELTTMLKVIKYHIIDSFDPLFFFFLLPSLHFVPND